MNKMTPIASFLFAIALAVFGIQHFIYGHFVLTPFPSWVPLQTALAWISGIFTIAVAFCILIRRMDRPATLLLGILYLLNTILLHIPRVIAELHNGNEWTGCFEMLGLSCGSLLLAGTLRAKRKISGSSNASWNQFTDRLTDATPYLFSACLLVYAGLHYVYADYIATLIPSWIPARLFLSWFIGVAFLLSAIAVAIKKFGRLASSLMGLMFYIWFLILHIPRVIASPQTETEWTSAFVALALGSTAWILASVLPE
jgi:uncharacterized membrane protein